MEELLKEILVELKQINSGVIMSADDLQMLLDREKEALKQRSRSIFNTVSAKGDVEAKEKLYAVPNLIRKIIDENFSQYVGKVNTPKRIIISNSEAKAGGIAKVYVECEDTSKYEFWAKMA